MNLIYLSWLAHGRIVDNQHIEILRIYGPEGRAKYIEA
jgi:hypothetical protein